MSSQKYRIALAYDFLANFADRSFASDALIREVIMNAFEADATRLDITVLGNGDLLFLDNGSGMDENEFKEFWIIGLSRKKGTSSPRFYRPRAGVFGIGKISLFKAFGAVKVQAHRGEFDATLLATRESLVTMKVTKLGESPLSHDGMKITLMGRLAPDPLFTEDGLTSYIQSRLSHILSAPHLQIYVNGRMVDPLTAKGLKTTVEVDEPIPGLGEITGTIEVMKRGSIAREIQGIQVTVRGGAIGRRTLFGRELLGLSPERVTGYIEAEFLEPAILYSREGFDEASTLYRAFHEKIWEIFEQRVKPAIEAQEKFELSLATALAYREAIKRLARALAKEGSDLISTREVTTQSAKQGQPKELAPQPSFELAQHSTDSTSRVTSSERIPRGTAQETTQTIEKTSPTRYTSIPPRPESPVSAPGTGEVEVQASQPQAAMEAHGQPLEARPTLPLREELVPPAQKGPDSFEPAKPLGETGRTKKAPNKLQIKAKRVGGWLIDFIEVDAPEPVLRQGDTIYLNLKHESYAALARKRDALVYHLTRLVTQELAKDRYDRAEDAFQAQDKLITSALLT